MNFTPTQIREMAKAQQEYMVKVRRYLHAHPEVSNKEYETSKFIEVELNNMGICYFKPSDTGIIATINGACEGKTVLLRADMDALPMEENENNLKGKKVCCSENSGVAHTCGHDGHIAMLLGVAKILTEIKDQISGTIILCFEDGEEVCMGKNYNELQGAGAIINALKNVKIDGCYATHLYVGLPSGKICLDEGPRMAGIARFDVEFTGKGGHGSRPDQAISPIFAVSYTLTNLANVWVNEIDVTKTVTLGVGYINGGHAFNIIPNTVEFGGSLRFFDFEEGEKATKSLERVIRTSAEMHRCTVTKFEIGDMGSCVNNPEHSKKARKAVGEVLGNDALVSCPPWFASESYSYYQRKWGGVLAHLGINNIEKGIGELHHNPKFDIDEDVLEMGTASAVAYALEILA